MADLKRAGPPTTKNGSDWSVRLDATPDAEWRGLLVDQAEHSSIAHPRLIRLAEHELQFKTDEEHVEHWIGFIDKWIARANERYRDVQNRRAQDRKREGDAAAAERERIVRLNERFKDL